MNPISKLFRLAKLRKKRREIFKSLDRFLNSKGFKRHLFSGAYVKYQGDVCFSVGINFAFGQDMGGALDKVPEQYVKECCLLEMLVSVGFKSLNRLALKFPNHYYFGYFGGVFLPRDIHEEFWIIANDESENWVVTPETDEDVFATRAIDILDKHAFRFMESYGSIDKAVDFWRSTDEWFYLTLAHYSNGEKNKAIECVRKYREKFLETHDNQRDQAKRKILKEKTGLDIDFEKMGKYRLDQFKVVEDQLVKLK